jgi:hypothetical protein
MLHPGVRLALPILIRVRFILSAGASIWRMGICTAVAQL